METLLREVIKHHIKTGQVAGVSLLVQKDGEEICFLAEGMADVEKQVPMKRDTIIRLYSQTKPITAAAAMILIERGILDLGQPVSDFLPAYQNLKVWKNGKEKAAARQIRIWDLLNMTSGLCYPDESFESGRQAAKVFEEIDKRLYSDHPMTTREVADALAGCALAFEPSSDWRYGTSADVLGAVIEAAAGKPFADFLKEELFVPLDMTDTDFYVPEDKQERLSQTYESVAGEKGMELKLYTGDHLGIQNRMKHKPAFASGGAGLASTLDDYMRFAKMLLNGGELEGVRILKEETVRYLIGGELGEWQQEAFLEHFDRTGYSYGNLMRVCKNASQAQVFTREGEYGWDGWLAPYFANFEKENMTILMAMQKMNGGTWSLTRKLNNIIVSSVLK